MMAHLHHICSTIFPRICRSDSKAEAAAKEIRSASKSKSIHAVSADLGSMAQIRSMASQLQQSHPRIHCLINNAGKQEPPAERGRTPLQLMPV